MHFTTNIDYTLKVISSNINEVIRSVLNFLFSFYDKISQVQKSTKRIQGTKKYQKALKSIINTTNLRFIV